MKAKLNLSTALDAFVKADGNASTSAIAYMRLAVSDMFHGYAKAADLIETICDKTGSRGAVIKGFPKGKANPNALKQNGYSGLAEASRLLKKISDKPLETRPVVEAFLGYIQNPVEWRLCRDGDKRVVAAIAKGERKAIVAAIRTARAQYLRNIYPDRPETFNGLRAALDKATASKKSQEALEAPAPANDGDTGDTGEISANAALVAKADIFANATIAELATALVAALAHADDAARAAADMELTALFAAMAGAAEAPALAKAA